MNNRLVSCQTLRSLYLHRILLSLDLFIVVRRVLKRASMCTWKQMSMFSGSRDIGQLVFSTDDLIS